MAMVPHFLEHTLAINFLFQAPQRFFHGLALFEFDLCQRTFTSSLRLGRSAGSHCPGTALKSGDSRLVFTSRGVNWQNTPGDEGDEGATGRCPVFERPLSENTKR